MLDLLVVIWLMVKWWYLFGRVIVRWCVSERKIHIRRCSVPTSATIGDEFSQTDNCSESDNVTNQTVVSGNKASSSCRQRHQIKPNLQNVHEEYSTDDNNLDTNLNITKTYTANDKSLGARSKVSKPKHQQSSHSNGYFISDRLHDGKQGRPSKSPPKTEEGSGTKKRRSKSKSPTKSVSNTNNLDITDGSIAQTKTVHNVLSKSDKGLLSEGPIINSDNYKRGGDITGGSTKVVKETGLKVRTLDTIGPVVKEKESYNLSQFINGKSSSKKCNRSSKSKSFSDDSSSDQRIHGTENASYSTACREATVNQNGVSTSYKLTETTSTKSYNQVEFVAKSDLRPSDLPGLEQHKHSEVNDNDTDTDDDEDENTLVEDDPETLTEEQMAYRRSLSVDSNRDRSFVPSVDRITVYEKYMAGQNQELISQMSNRRRSYEYLGARERSPDDHQSVTRVTPGAVIVTKRSPKRSRYASSMTEISERRRFLSAERETHVTLSRDKYAKYGSASRLNLTEGVIRCKIREHMSNIIGKQLYASDDDVMYTYNIDNPLHGDHCLSSIDRNIDGRSISDSINELDATVEDAASDINDTSHESGHPEGYLADAELDSSATLSVVDGNETVSNKLTILGDYVTGLPNVADKQSLPNADVSNVIVEQFDQTVSNKSIILPFEENFDVLQSESTNSIVCEESSGVTEDIADNTEDEDESFDLSELALGSYDFSSLSLKSNGTSLLSLKSDGTEVSEDLGGSAVTPEDHYVHSSVSKLLYIYVPNPSKK